MDSDKVLSIYDMADWLFSFRWLAVIFLILGCWGTLLVWWTSGPPQPTYSVSFDIFVEGTAVRPAQQVSDILSGRLVDVPGVTLLSEQTANPLIVSVSSEAQAKELAVLAEQWSTELFEETKRFKTKLQPLAQTSEGALSKYLAAATFVDGVDMGLVKLVRARTLTTTSQRSPTAVAVPLLLAFFGFFLLAGFITFLRGWRKHSLRNTTAS